MAYFYMFLGWLAGFLALIGLGVGLFILCGTVCMDALFAAHRPRGELTCWHCGEQTRAGVKHCTHCGGELQ